MTIFSHPNPPQIIREQKFWKSQPMGFMRAINDIWCSLQPNTIEKYCYSLRNFYQFSLLEKGEILLPVDILEASRFLISLRERNYSKFTIKLGLVSIKWANSFFPGAPRLDDPFLSRIVLSAKKNCVSKRRQKEPLSKEMLRKILELGPDPSLIEVRDALIPAISYTLLLSRLLFPRGPKPRSSARPPPPLMSGVKIPYCPEFVLRNVFQIER